MLWPRCMSDMSPNAHTHTPLGTHQPRIFIFFFKISPGRSPDPLSFSSFFLSFLFFPVHGSGLLVDLNSLGYIGEMQLCITTIVSTGY